MQLWWASVVTFISCLFSALAYVVNIYYKIRSCEEVLFDTVNKLKQRFKYFGLPGIQETQ